MWTSHWYPPSPPVLLLPVGSCRRRLLAARVVDCARCSVQRLYFLLVHRFVGGQRNEGEAWGSVMPVRCRASNMVSLGVFPSLAQRTPSPAFFLIRIEGSFLLRAIDSPVCTTTAGATSTSLCHVTCILVGALHLNMNLTYLQVARDLSVAREPACFRLLPSSIVVIALPGVVRGLCVV